LNTKLILTDEYGMFTLWCVEMELLRVRTITSGARKCEIFVCTVSQSFLLFVVDQQLLLIF